VFSHARRALRASAVSFVAALVGGGPAARGAGRPPGSRIGVVTASGGQAELILDVASEAQIELPPLPANIRADAERVIGPLTGDGNPLDAWGNGNFAVNFPHALKCLDADPDCDVIVLFNDANDGNPMGRETRALDYAKVVAEAAKTSKKPHYMMSTRPGMMQRAQIALLAEEGVPVLGGARQGLGAIVRLAEAGRKAPKGCMNENVGPSALADMVAAAKGRPTIHEADAKKLFGDEGLPITREIVACDWNAVRAAAQKIGWPVALKVISDHIAHKSEHGLVALGINNDAELSEAHDLLFSAAKKIAAEETVAGLLVQEMVPGGLEIFVGVNRDPEFGLVIAAGLGGVGVEFFKDFALRLLPLREGDAAAMLAELKVYPLLRGARSIRPYDIEALTILIERVGDIAWKARDYLGEIDLNPVKVFEQGRGCRILDALIVPRKGAKWS
jgi:acyl-CoA synthetase (NDP forming)